MDQESTETTEPTTTETAAPEETPQQGETFDAAYVKKLREEAAKWRTQAREYGDKAKKLDQIEEQSKSELQKAVERAEKAEAEAQAVKVERLRLEVAAEKGVPAGLLVGTTAEELAASADALVEFRGKQEKPAEADFGAGARGAKDSGAPVQYTRAQMLAMTPDEVVAADQAGHFNDLKAGRLS